MPNPPQDLLNALAANAPELTKEVNELTQEWLAPVLMPGFREPSKDKHFNDPIWGTITLHPWEVALLDTPLAQRLRGVKQLGLAHLVFPSATHDRFSHLCGVVAAADRMMDSLARNAVARSDDEQVINIRTSDRYRIRLAALIHDVGHGPFSHAIEPVVERIYKKELESISAELKQQFQNVGRVSPSEAIAVLIVASDAFREVLAHSMMAKVADTESPAELSVSLIAALVGGDDNSLRGCLVSIVSSQIDADKLDYMARDAYHAGLPIDFDTHRLINKLEFLTVEESALLPRLKLSLLDRVRASPHQRYADIGISYGGTGAFEQMLVGRVFLYDRLYHHHKVRAADAMAQRLVYYAAPGRQGLTLRMLYSSISDDAIIRAFGGSLHLKSNGAGELQFPTTPESRYLSECIINRRLYKRAFAFAGRFITSQTKDAAPEHDDDSRRLFTQKEQREDAERRRVMRRLNKDLAELPGCLSAEKRIADWGVKIGKLFENGHQLHEQSKSLRRHHVIVNLPKSPHPTRITIIARMDDGKLDVPDVFYDPSRWAAAYDIQRRTGYVFADDAHRELVALAARIWFYKKYRCVLDEAADRYSRTNHLLKPEWYDTLVRKKILTKQAAHYLKRPRLAHGPFDLPESHIPSSWHETDPEFRDRFNGEFNAVLPDGIPAIAENDLTTTIEAIFNYVQTRSEGAFVRRTVTREKELQEDLLQSLRDQGCDAVEGAKMGGGETDIIVETRVVIENKLVKEPTDDPFGRVPHAGIQARRYVLSTGQKFVITMVAYCSKTETGKLPPSKCIQVRQISGVEIPFAEIRVVVRYGDTRPSAVPKSQA